MAQRSETTSDRQGNHIWDNTVDWITQEAWFTPNSPHPPPPLTTADFYQHQMNNLFFVNLQLPIVWMIPCPLNNSKMSNRINYKLWITKNQSMIMWECCVTRHYSYLYISSVCVCVCGLFQRLVWIKDFPTQLKQYIAATPKCASDLFEQHARTLYLACFLN